MVFKRFIAVPFIFAASLFIGSAHAIPVTEETVDINDSHDVIYSYFSITTRGGITLTADRVAPGTVDPYLYLFRDSGDGSPTTDNFIASNDDGGGFPNSRISRLLGTGDYIAAVGNYYLSLSEVINGYNGPYNSGGTGSVALGISGATGWLLNPNNRWRYVTTAGEGTFTGVPEPTGIALFGAGLIAFGVARRRRKSD